MNSLKKLFILASIFFTMMLVQAHEGHDHGPKDLPPAAQKQGVVSQDSVAENIFAEVKGSSNEIKLYFLKKDGKQVKIITPQDTSVVKSVNLEWRLPDQKWESITLKENKDSRSTTIVAKNAYRYEVKLTTTVLDKSKESKKETILQIELDGAN